MTHYPASVSGPREPYRSINCSSCHRIESTTECACCLDALCSACAIECGVCGSGELCVACAPRRGLERVGDKWCCEECAVELNPPLVPIYTETLENVA